MRGSSGGRRGSSAGASEPQAATPPKIGGAASRMADCQPMYELKDAERSADIAVSGCVATHQAHKIGTGATPAQLREAERGLRLMLRRRFSARWIAENAADLLQQANVEYAEWLKVNPPARNPVGWLLTCAERRAKNLLDTQTRRGTPASLDEVFHLADEATPSPEQQVLDHDRHERLVKALSHLPEKECKLLALVYFRDHSIREAGRKLGWQKSAADRHHREAMAKLRALVGEDRSLLAPAHVGLAAWAITYGERHRFHLALDALLAPAREALAVGQEGGEWAARQLGEAARRLSTAGDSASAFAGGGGGRLAGACGVAVATVACGIVAGGVVNGTGSLGAAAAHRQRAARETAAPSVPGAELPTPQVPGAKAAGRSTSRSGADAATAPRVSQAKEPSTRKPRRRARRKSARRATTPQTVNEFGVEAGSVPSTEAAPVPESPEGTSGSSGSSSEGSSGSSGGSSSPSPSKAGNGSEFAM
ncbi:MAG TPA: sigma-70 family RNA polymerase sigma factor [Solirubrobacterales bacterium]